MADAPRLTLHDQLLINLCGWLACTRWHDPNHALVVDQLRRVIPVSAANHPLIGPLREAAVLVLDHIHQPGSIALMGARLDLNAACQTVFLARAAQAAAAIWPEQNLATPAPEAAHAAE